MEISTHNVHSDIIATFRHLAKKFGPAISDIIRVDDFTQDDGVSHDFTCVTLTVKGDDTIKVKMFSSND